jgi:hypothetical protein
MENKRETTDETFKWLFEKPYLIKTEKLIRGDRCYDIDVVHFPEATHQSNNIHLLIFYGKTLLHKEVFQSGYEKTALGRQKYILENIDDLLIGVFKGSKLAHYLGGDVFKTVEVMEYFMDIEINEEGFQKAVSKSRIIMVDPKTLKNYL